MDVEPGIIDHKMFHVGLGRVGMSGVVADDPGEKHDECICSCA